MSFAFRGVDMEIPYYCLIFDSNVLDGSTIVHRGGRFPFHEKNKLKKGLDLCHRYSFDAMSDLLCWVYNTAGFIKNPNEETTVLDKLVDIMYKSDFMPQDEDFDSANNILRKLYSDTNSPAAVLHYFNELLYILNNARINLRAGDKSWNRSIGSGYDAEEWVTDGQKIVITSYTDVYLLSNLLTIPVYPSTIYFYTALSSTKGPILYSSDNSFPYEGISAYQEVKIPIYISNSKGSETAIV